MITEHPVIGLLDVDIRTVVSGFVLGADRLGTGQLGGNESYAWTPYLAEATRVETLRGGKRSGVVNTMDVGTLMLSLLASADPTLNPDIRPNVGIRLRSKATGLTLFTGSVVDVDMKHVVDKTKGTVQTFVTLSAVDAVQAHANTNRYGAIVPGGYEFFEERVARLALSSIGPVNVPTLPPDLLKYQLDHTEYPTSATGADALDGWTLLGPYVLSAVNYGKTSNDQVATQLTRVARLMGSTLVTAFSRESFANTAPANDGWLDSREAEYGIKRTVTGLTPGKLYRLTASAGIAGNLLGGPVPAGYVDTYRVGVLGVGWADSLTITEVLPVVNHLPEFTFRATAASHEIAVRLTGIFSNTKYPSGTYWEDLSIADIRLHEIQSAAPYALQSAVYESTLLNHFDLTCSSVGARWWVDADGVTQFRAGLEAAPPVASFSDVRAPGVLEYVDLDTRYDTRNVVNDLALTNHGVGLDDAGDLVADDPTYGVTDSGSVAQWGPRSASIDTNLYDTAGYAGSVALRAAEILAVNAAPEIQFVSIRWNAQELPAAAAQLDIYSRVDVTFRGSTQQLRVISVKHSVTPTRWMTTLQLTKG